MKNYILTNIVTQIKKSEHYSNDEIEIIRYGLESIYILITKIIIISLLAMVIGIFKEFIIFLLIYNIIRMPSFGLHATKSWICLVASSLIFLLAPYIAVNSNINIYVKSVLGIISICLMFKNAPADTKKRPIVSRKRRLAYKYISVFTAIFMVISSFIISNNFISNAFILALVVQCFMISPTIYKIFKLPYNNYLQYKNA